MLWSPSLADARSELRPNVIVNVLGEDNIAPQGVCGADAYEVAMSDEWRYAAGRERCPRALEIGGAQRAGGYRH